MGNILFQSDYGLGNGTAELSGICLRVDPALQIYTLSHDLPRLDVAAAAAHLAAARSVVTRADLDGPSLCSEDPYTGGPVFEGSRILMNEAPGLGITAVPGFGD